jgi:beta-glucanase (GH16 family)
MKFSIALIVLLFSCGKTNSTANDVLPPLNLTVNAIVATDNSGNVSFTASANNATTYEYDFGNGVFQIVPSGNVNYKYSSSGTYTVNVIAKNSIGQTISKSIQITLSASIALVWSDEFDTPGAPNASKWGYDIGTGSGGWGNNELQYYTNRSQNVVVSGGTLKINLLKETYSGSNYTSTRMLTKDKFSVKYGKIEARAKLPAGLGTWPAIWMLGNNITSAGWPACGEIDIMEHRGSELNKIWGSLHYPGRSGANPDGSTVMINNATTEFHKYAVEWNASSIKFYVDDALFYTFANSASVPYNQNFFILLNVAMGGNFGGTVDPNFSNATMEVDYIRVYQ